MAWRIPGPEGPEVEWKERLSGPFRVAATMCAFANGRGGVIVFGVRDTGEAVGVDDPAEVRRAVREIARQRMEPGVRIETAVRRLSGVSVVEVRVFGAASRPVRAVRKDGSEVACLREGSSSRPAQAGEERALGSEPGHAARADAEGLRLLQLIRDGRADTEGGLAQAVNRSRRTVRRALVPLLRGGLILQQSGGRLWLTPDGHHRLRK